MKLLQFTDFHLRSSPPPQGQFHVQPFWHSEWREMFARIGQLATNADAILFTGDATHGGGKASVAAFFDFLAEIAQGRPVFMVLGNHDVVDPDWSEHFHRGVEQHHNFKLDDGVYSQGAADIVLINNEYLNPAGATSTSWRDDCFPVPAMTGEQSAKLNAALSASTDRPAIALVHCPSHVLPSTLFDIGAAARAGMDRYRETLHALLDAHPRVGLVLSGHVHFTSTAVFNHGRVHECLSSVIEYPYHIRIIDITQSQWSTRLVPLAKESEAESNGIFGGSARK